MNNYDISVSISLKDLTDLGVRSTDNFIIYGPKCSYYMPYVDYDNYETIDITHSYTPEYPNPYPLSYRLLKWVVYGHVDNDETIDIIYSYTPEYPNPYPLSYRLLKGVVYGHVDNDDACYHKIMPYHYPFDQLTNLYNQICIMNMDLVVILNHSVMVWNMKK
jgi:hypothetical protein